MYMSGRGFDFASFYDISTCFDSVVFFFSFYYHNISEYIQPYNVDDELRNEP